ncbi:hypothetical protein KFE25_010281 [Diacronema lutheri]|uniref:ATP-dependent RNA helicase n=2 Tax=Diacronema lutheri TaxID=2081491 RepID=A0A8J6C904_DIALT|nr:hypothetical protein KFE25_010281 [Diacronema lutheri]
MRAAHALLLGLAPTHASALRAAAARARVPIRRLLVGGAKPATVASATAPAASPLRFDALPLLPGTQAALAREFGYEMCSPVQQAAIPLGLAGYDLLARAQTGTGKTLAFLIPAVERIGRAREAPRAGHASVLILAPTRELAQQTAREAERLCAHLVPAVRVQAMIGGSPVERERTQLRRAGLGDVLVATPGRIADHLRTTPGFPALLGSVHTFVLDEVDQLLDGGFRVAVSRIVSALPAATERQTLLFSATLSDEIRAVARQAMRAGDATRIVDCVGAGAQDATAALLEQRYAFCAQQAELLPTLWRVVRGAQAKEMGKIIVFCPTARLTQLAARLAERTGACSTVIEIHSRKSQTARDKASAAFRDARSAVLFTSDVSARGVDYPDVALVVQLGCPATREQYVHRTGRSARAGKDGSGLLLLCEFERPFLNELRGLDITPLSERDRFWDGGAQPREASTDRPRTPSPPLMRDDPELEALGILAYQSWLGFYRGLAKTLHWSDEELVRAANGFARSIGFDEPPALEARVLSKMGLKGTPAARLDRLDRPAARLDPLDRAAARLDRLDRPAARLDPLDRPAARLDRLDRPAARLDPLDRPAARLDRLDRHLRARAPPARRPRGAARRVDALISA